jgi:hypothetical protein
MSKTAVQWFAFELSKLGLLPNGVPNELYEQAKQMEKQQIEDAWCNGFDEDDRATSNPFKYYNETYGGN